MSSTLLIGLLLEYAVRTNTLLVCGLHVSINATFEGLVQTWVGTRQKLIHSHCRDEDNFLYVSYSGENTFGSSARVPLDLTEVFEEL